MPVLLNAEKSLMLFMRLKDLLKGFVPLPNSSLGAAEDMQITSLALDSREVTQGNVFIALAGARQHGLVHVAQPLKMVHAQLFLNLRETASNWLGRLLMCR